MADTITIQEAHNRAVKAGVLASIIIMARNDVDIEPYNDAGGTIDSSVVDNPNVWHLALSVYNSAKPQASDETRAIVRGILERVAMIREEVGG